MLLPQHLTPPMTTAQVNLYPEDIEVTPEPLGIAITGSTLESVVPLPS
jgi:hypothetical protein